MPLDLRVAEVVEQAPPAAHEDRHDMQHEFVQPPRADELLDQVGASGQRDVLVAGRLTGQLQCAGGAFGDEVVGRAALLHHRLACLVGDDEHRRVERRLVAPRDLPGDEHAVPHDHRPQPVDPPGEQLVVRTARAALRTLHPAEAPQPEHPGVQPLPADAQRMLRPRFRARDVPVQRNAQPCDDLGHDNLLDRFLPLRRTGRDGIDTPAPRIPRRCGSRLKGVFAATR